MRSRTLPWLCIAAVITSAVICEAQARKNRIVVVVSLDGFPAYALDDPRLPVPTLRRLAREGVIADSMRPINPTVTWPNHTAIVTGVDASEHHVLFNGLLSRPSDSTLPISEPWRDKSLMVHAPTIYDIAYEAGLTTAQVDWVAIYGAKTITWQFPELPSPEGPVERQMIKEGTVTAEELRAFEDSSQAWQDQMWTHAALKILKEHQPNLLLFHLLTVDDMNHQYGPMTPASLTAMALVDGYVKQVVDLLESSGLKERTTLIVVSDHGFRGIDHKIHPNVLLREKGLVKGTGNGASGDAWVMSTGGTAMVYITDRSRAPALAAEIRNILTSAEGIDRVYGVEEFSDLGLPLPSVSSQGPDLMLAAKPGYSFGNENSGDYVTTASGGTHGYINTDPKMQSIFLAWGAGVPAGVRVKSISNLDIAPTIAAILGLQMRNVKGKPIDPIVKPTQDKRTK